MMLSSPLPLPPPSHAPYSWPSMWGGAPYEFEELKAPQCFDWWGVNYYTRWAAAVCGLLLPASN